MQANQPGKACLVPPTSRGTGRRIVLATFGSFGDLHPYIALGLGLQARGHRACIATCAVYREKVEGEGLEFHPIRPDIPKDGLSPKLMRQVMDARNGSQYVIREMMMPAVRDQYEDLLEAVQGADLLISHIITYAAPIVGEKLGLPWVSTTLQPVTFLSATDPPAVAPSPGLLQLCRRWPWFSRILFRTMKKLSRPWAEPVDRLRADLGLPRAEHPIFASQFSPYLNLALFSDALAAPQPDWPDRTLVTGFPFYDRFAPGLGMPADLEAFLQAGPPPLVFTLGSSAVMIGDDFYTESIVAAKMLGQRAVLLVGQDEWNRLPRPLPDGIFACAYAPHSELFPRASVNIHQGGVGTTGQALRSGRPMLVVPFAHDQPDHAGRITRLGVGSWLPRRRYNAHEAADALRRILESPAITKRAEEVGRKVRSEDGVGAACEALEMLLARCGGTKAPSATR